MSELPSGANHQRTDVSDVLFRVGGALMCVVFTAAIGITSMSAKGPDWPWMVWLALASLATLLASAGAFMTARNYWRGW